MGGGEDGHCIPNDNDPNIRSMVRSTATNEHHSLGSEGSSQTESFLSDSVDSADSLDSVPWALCRTHAPRAIHEARTRWLSIHTDWIRCNGHPSESVSCLGVRIFGFDGTT